MPERSKGLVLSSNVFALVGSNPTSCKALIAQMVERGSYEPKVVGSSPTKSNVAPLAQMVERGSNKPKVTGSRPVWSIWRYGLVGYDT